MSTEGKGQVTGHAQVTDGYTGYRRHRSWKGHRCYRTQNGHTVDATISKYLGTYVCTYLHGGNWSDDLTEIDCYCMRDEGVNIYIFALCSTAG